MAKKNNKRPIRKMVDRNLIAGPWTPLQRAAVPDEAKKTEVVAAFQNSRYTVWVKEMDCPAFGQKGPDGKVIPMRMVHLIVVRNDKKEVRSWTDLQRIKNEILGPMAEGVELFPAEWRRLEMKQTHLWFLSPGAGFPFGLVPEGIDALAEAEKEAQEYTLKKEDLEVFVVRTEGGDDKIIEVFADKDEAVEMYAAAGNELGDNGAIERIGEVPTEEDGAGWTDRAKAKVAQVLRKAEQMENLMARASDSMDDDGDNPIVIDNDPGPEGGMIEDEIAEDGDFDFGKPGDEEFLNIEQLMRDGIAARQVSRQKSVEQAKEFARQESIRMEQEEESERQAADDLAKMRKNMLKH